MTDSYVVPEDAGREWLAGVAEQLRGNPERIPGPHGDPVAAAYGRPGEATLSGHVDVDGRMAPIAFEIVPGVTVELADLRFEVPSDGRR